MCSCCVGPHTYTHNLTAYNNMCVDSMCFSCTRPKTPTVILRVRLLPLPFSQAQIRQGRTHETAIMACVLHYSSMSVVNSTTDSTHPTRTLCHGDTASIQHPQPPATVP